MFVKAGLVGIGPVCDLIIRCLEERTFPLAQPLRVAAMGKKTSFDKQSEIFSLDISDYDRSLDFFKGLDIVFFADQEGPQGASVTWAHRAIQQYGCFCIDSGSDYRLDPDVPLIVPEVNMNRVNQQTKLIASPNCVVTPIAVALWPLHKAATIKRIVISTYQSVSGWGAAAHKQLWKELKQLIRYGLVDDINPKIFPRPIALDCIPHIGRFLPNGNTEEEMKIVSETRRILEIPDLKVSATAVRVPIGIGHSISINVEFEQSINADSAREILSDPIQSPGVAVIDGKTRDPNAITFRNAPEELQYPTQLDVIKEVWKDAVLVGRIRDDSTVKYGLNLWCVSNNLRKGSATNVVQIARQLLKSSLISRLAD